MAWSVLLLLCPAVPAAAWGVQEGDDAEHGPATAPVAPVPDSTGAPAAPPRARDTRPIVEEIVVTAQKREEAITDVPIAVSAFSGEQLNALGMIDTRDMDKLVPGFTTGDSGYNTPIYTLRGIGFNDSTYTATSTVGVYTDEVSLPYSIMTKGPAVDLQRVEVLKGPQGTLFGRNTTGGAINYVANKPADHRSWGLRGGYGSFRTSDLEVFVSGPLGETLRGRFAARGLWAEEGWQTSNTDSSRRLGRQDQQAVRALLDWLPSEDLSIRLMLSGWRDAGDPQAPQAVDLFVQNPLPGAALFVAPSVRDYPYVPLDSNDPRVADWCECLSYGLKDSFWQAAATLKWNPRERLELTSIIGYGRVRSDGSRIPQSGFNFQHFDQSIDAGIESTGIELRLSGFSRQETVNWMFGVAGAFDSGFEDHYILGGNNTQRFPIGDTGLAIIGDEFIVGGDTEARSLAAFGDVTWDFTRSLSLTAGARYTREKRDYTGCTQGSTDDLAAYTLFTVLSLQRRGAVLSQAATDLLAALTEPAVDADAMATLFDQAIGVLGGDFIVEPGSCLTIDEEGDATPFEDVLRENNVSGRVALSWRPADGQLLYVSFARGFKSGGYPVLNASDQSQYEPVEQEQLNAYEIGAKSTFMNGGLRMNLAAFYYDYYDKQLLTRQLDPIFGPLPVLKNAPRSNVRGIEFDVSAAPLAGLFLAAAASYIETEIEEFQSTNIQGDPQDFSGRPFNFTPELTYNLLIDYSFPLFRDFEMGLGADYLYRGSTNSTLEGDPVYTHRSYDLVNARVRLRREGSAWSVLLYGRNLGDSFSTVSVVGGAGDAVIRFAGRPRTLGVMLDYRFE